MSVKTSIKPYTDPALFFEAIKELRVLIIGDVMIDAYLWGRVDRISPEAPVPVVLVEKTDKRLGGAANVAINLQALGATPVLCSVVGEDAEGVTFFELMGGLKLPLEGIVKSASRKTTIKHRILSGGHHLLRIDSENENNLNVDDSEKLLKKILALLPRVDAVVFEDYDKGVLSETLITQVVNACIDKGIPTIVDPKKRNFLQYKNVSLFKPNKKELREGLKWDNPLTDIQAIKDAAVILREGLKADTVLITLSEQGILLDSERDTIYIPAHKREICDVSGAGDTVISVAAVAYTLGLSPRQVAALSNLAGGIVCEQVGVVPIDKALFLQEIKKLAVFSNAGNTQ